MAAKIYLKWRLAAAKPARLPTLTIGGRRIDTAETAG
jgi:hypothetical protein